MSKAENAKNREKSRKIAELNLDRDEKGESNLRLNFGSPPTQFNATLNATQLVSDNIADLNNSGSSSFAGAITAALFLKEFVPSQVDWVHIDSYCWNDRSRVGRPIGGEATAIRTLFSFLQKRYC